MGVSNLPPGVAGPGRPKGLPNKATVKAKEAIAALIEGNADKIKDWAEEVYKTKGAADAIDIYLKFSEFCIPKLARVEVAGDQENPVNHSLTVKFVGNE